MTVITIVRRLSGRRIAYPRFSYVKTPGGNNLRGAMQQFLGPRDYKGQYLWNRYAQPAKEHQPKYIQPQMERGRPLRDPATGQVVEAQADPRDGSIKYVPVENIKDSYVTDRPFPQNKFCVSNKWVDTPLREELYREVELMQRTPEEVGHEYGLSPMRVEAIVKLYGREKKVKVSSDVERMSKTLEQMFPLYEPSPRRMEEIEMTNKSQFITLAESEPFGPLDAANLLGLKPAKELLLQQGEHAKKKHQDRVVYGPVRAGDRSVFKIKDVPGYKSAIRYGSGQRDNKRDRRVGFDSEGRMVYL